MERWEYKTEIIFYDERSDVLLIEQWTRQIERRLNKLGEEGWEIVYFPDEIFKNATQGYAVFKRRKKEGVSV